jgi:hypothetical protein
MVQRIAQASLSSTPCVERIDEPDHTGSSSGGQHGRVVGAGVVYHHHFLGMFANRRYDLRDAGCLILGGDNHPHSPFG